MCIFVTYGINFLIHTHFSRLFITTLIHGLKTNSLRSGTSTVSDSTRRRAEWQMLQTFDFSEKSHFKG